MVNKRYKALNKSGIQIIFFSFQSSTKHVVGANWKCLNEALQMNTTTNVYIEKINMKNLTIFSVVGKATEVGAMGWNALSEAIKNTINKIF